MIKNEIMLISAGYDQQIKFWTDFNNNKCKHVFEVKEGPINALEMVPNKDEIAFTVMNSVKFLDLNNLSLTQNGSIVNNSANIVSNLLFSKELDNVFFHSGEDCILRMNDRRLGKTIKEFKHKGYINSIEMGFDNKEIIASDEAGELKIWDINKSEIRTEYVYSNKIEGNAFRSTSVSLDNNKGFIVSGHSNGKCQIFDYSKGNDLSVISTFDAHKSYVTKVLLNIDKT